MAKILFSMAGEGRGHATRVRSIVEELKNEHEFLLLAPHVAYDFLAQMYTDVPNVTVKEIPGLQFYYHRQRCCYVRSFLYHGLPYLKRMPSLLRELRLVLEQEQPDLVVTDFEPAIARSAKRCGIPFISFDHQHFLVVTDLSSLPWNLRLKAWCIAQFVQHYYCGQQSTIVSSFFSPPLKRGHEETIQIGVLLRPEILDAQVTAGDHLLVYLRRFARPNLMEALRRCGREVRVYGLGPKPSEGNLHYRPVGEASFIADLSSCFALVSNAGNQLVGEALYFRKPVLVLPESGNTEQAVNAHFLRQSGAGDWAVYEKLTGTDLQRFLAMVPRYQLRINTQDICGNQQAVDVILSNIPSLATAPTRQSPKQVA